jgi:hypothetical protein
MQIVHPHDFQILKKMSEKENLVRIISVGFEVLMVVMKSTGFWDATPCSLLEANRRFGCLHLQG